MRWATIILALAWAGSLPAQTPPVRVGESLSADELEEMVRSAARRRMELERQVVVTEMSQNLLYDKGDIDRAAQGLRAGSAETSEQNIALILKAYRTVDPEFDEAMTLLQKDQSAEAAELFKTLLDSDETTCLSAAVHYQYARSLLAADKPWAAVEVLSELMANMPDRISFAAAGALQAAEIYRSLGRGMYALEMTEYALDNYGLALSDEQVLTLTDRAEQLRQRYNDPMGTTAALMADVAERLARRELEERTIDKQEAIIALLDDLIKTAEEKNRSNDSQRQPQDRRRRQGEQQPQRRQRQQQQGGQSPMRTSQPVSPARQSSLVPGPVARPSRLARRQGQGESGSWADLPPREKEQVRNLMQHRMGQQRGEMVRDYHRKLAEGQ